MTGEKRGHSRLKLHVPVELMLESNASQIRAETADLSRSGCYVEVLFTLDQGMEVPMTIQVGDSSLLAIGKVVTRDPNVRNGIQFTKMLPEDREELKRFIQAAESAKDANVEPAAE